MVKYIHPSDFQTDRRHYRTHGLGLVLWQLCGKLAREGLHLMEGRTIKKLLQNVAMTPWVTAGKGEKC